ncbi:MAG: PEP-CTERM sorting domain-containing protein [Planctomycetia bacterium]|jgi:hypothetical protein
MSTKKFFLMTLVSVSVVCFIANLAFAAPSLDITKLSSTGVQPFQSWTGPRHDPHATQGQWFLNMDGTEEYRTNEFYDNVYNEDVLDSGGGFAGSFAIVGKSTNVLMDAMNNIIAFDIDATITNDTPSIEPWRAGTNSHGEFLSTQQQYKGTLYDTKLAVEFAVDLPSFDAWRNNLAGAAITLPYTLVDPLIIAEEVDELGWYCWTPDNEAGLAPNGDYLVPTYDFGDILPGQSVTRTLHFSVQGGITPNDLRYEVLLSDEDLFLNRTTSLKISNWIENLVIDPGTPYPYGVDEMLLNSDVSVFHNVPEPSTLVLLTLALGMGLAMKIRRKK